MPTDLEQQVQQEQLQLQQAPAVQLGPAVQRCQFCGQLSAGGSEIRGPVAVNENPGQQQVRWRGRCCGG